MSRIERYQESIEKFINNKNILSQETRLDILKQDHLSGIILASIITNNIKKSNFKVHGYYMSIAIDLLYYLVTIQNQKNQDQNNTLNLFNTVYNLFQLNIESLKVPVKQESNNIKLISFIFSYLNSKLFAITKTYDFTNLKKMSKTDVININYITEELKTKLKNLILIKKSINFSLCFFFSIKI